MTTADPEPTTPAAADQTEPATVSPAAAEDPAEPTAATPPNPATSAEAASGTAPEPPNAPAATEELTAPEDAANSYLADLQRLKAEFDNYRRRVKEQQHESAQRATAKLIDQLLPVVDACEAARAAGEADPATADGTHKLAELLLATLYAQGLQAIRPLGEVFDPNIHEAIEHIEPTADEPASSEPTVAEVVRTGYFWQDKLLRPAMVKVKG